VSVVCSTLSCVISARGLARTFRKREQEVHAVVGVDLDVAAGEIVGFLGPNAPAGRRRCACSPR
jgi:ABC-type uncharacterized transport system ATPase subunit